MSRLTIDTGTEGNPATGDSLRGAFTKVNTNFQEIYNELGASGILSDLSFKDNIISTDNTNQNLILSPNGTGQVQIRSASCSGGFGFSGNILSTTDTNADMELDPAGTGNLILKSGNFLPATDNTLYLGSASKRWHSLYVGPGSIYVGDAQITSTGATINLPSNTTIGGVNITDQVNSSVTFVGDDSTGVTLSNGETLKIAGAGGVTTAVSGDTLTITGTAGGGGSITFVGDDSTGTAVSTGETIKIAGTQNITTAVSGDTLTITGSKNIDVNSISSGDSSAIQINDAVNIQGGLTVNGNTFNFSNVGAYENTMYLYTGENNPNNSYWGFSASGGYGHFQFQGDIERMSGANLKIAEGGGALIDTANGRRLIIHAGDAGDYNYADLYLKGANVTVETHGVYPGRGTFTVDGIQIQSNTLSTNSSNQNLELDAAGSGTIELLTNTNITGNIISTGTITGSNTNITVVGDDSTGTTFNIGETIKIAGAGTVTTSVSGDTITITGTAGGVGLGNLQVNNTTLSPITTNSNIKLEANGTGEIELISQKIKLGDNPIGGTVNLTTASAHQLTISINNNANSSAIEIIPSDGIFLNPNGSEKIKIDNNYWPNTDGTNGQTLITDGAGNLSWSSLSGAQGITFVGDDSTGTRVADGESFKIAGAGGVTTAVSGDTLTITGPNLSAYIESSFTIVTGDGSTTFSAVSNQRYGVNTSAGSITVNLPSTPATGDAIFFADAGGAYSTNNLTIGRNGNTIMGLSENMTISTNNSSTGLFYTGSTWRIYS